MRRNNKVLYEKIMRNVSKEVKRALNEDRNKFGRNVLYDWFKLGIGRENEDIIIERSDFDKMRSYRQKGSNPERLVNSIKDHQKLIARWGVAIMIGWTEAAEVFEQKIRQKYLLYGSNFKKVKEAFENMEPYKTERANANGTA
jgi:hypothetical protein